MVSAWYVAIAIFVGCLGIVAVIYWSGKIFAASLANWSGKIFAASLAIRPFWIVLYHHRHGVNSWPVFCRNRPDLDYLLKTDANFVGDWEPDREEWVEVFGPWYVGTYPYQKP